ncbi:sentrin-specific protease 1-like [Protopterus annectens]|uniref:sentrin-specific protease 1-like n=1 Tax=Protopterus annectens TaxID=7888 RepID=UPI001CFB9F49|nr:sentrin-specific protease 1-like [Protopterus annectens]
MLSKWYEWFLTLRTNRSGTDNGNDIGDPAPSGNSVLGRKRPRTSILDSPEQEPENNAKRFRLGEFVDTVKVAAVEVKEKTSTLMTWMKSRSPSLSSLLSSLPIQLMRPTLDSSPSQMIQSLLNRPTSQDGSVTCVARDPIKQQQYHCKVVTEFFKSDRSPPQEDTSLLFRRPRIPPEIQNKKELSMTTAVPEAPALGRSLRLEAWKTESGNLNAVAGKQNHQMYKSVYEKTFPIISVKRSRSCGALSPRKSQKRHCSTAEETIRHEEKELYKQLLQMVSNNQFPESRAVSPVSVIQSPRDQTSCIASPCLFKKTPSLDDQSSEGHENSLETFTPNTCNVELFPCRTGSPCHVESDTISDSSITSAQHDPLLSLDMQSTASDSDSVIVIKVKDAPAEESTSMPYFRAEQWIKELTSMYDSRARQRQKQIEEQEALALRLQKQRLEEEEPRKHRSVELKLRVPLEKEIPATIREEERKKEEKPRQEEEFPELTEKMEAEIQKAFNSGNQDEVLSDAFRLTITRKDIHTLKNLNWLNDEIINFYMNMLVDRSTNKMLPKVHAFNTFFFPRLKSAGFQAVKRWTKKVDIFAVDILLVPVHLGVHWCLAVVDFRKKSIEYYDSMGGSGAVACSLLLQYLKQECQDKKGKPFESNGWKLSSKNSQEIPQQMNGSDCGMFACKYADYITRGWPITFSQKHMPYFRKRMVWEILNQKLL